MGKMFTRLFSAIEKLFGVVEKGAIALDSIANVAVVNAKFYEDEAKLENAAKLAALGRDLKLAK